MLRLQFNWDIQDEEFLAMSGGEKFVCMFSGGKDSGLALAMANNIGKPVALIHCIKQPHHKNIFHSPHREVIERQASSMGIPAMFTELDPWYNPTCVANLYRSLKEKGVESVLFGNVSGEDNAAQLVGICRMSGLAVRMPLWKISKEKYFTEMRKYDVKSVISTVNERVLSPIWLKRQYNEQVYEGLSSIGVDPFGENGEYNTTLIGSSLFKNPLRFEIGAASLSEAPVIFR